MGYQHETSVPLIYFSKIKKAVMVNWILSSLPKLRNKVDCKLSYLFISAKSLLFCRILEWGFD